MATAVAAETPQPNTTQDAAPSPQRRITEADADYRRLHAATVKRLRASVAQLVREMRDGGRWDQGGAVTEFVARQAEILRDAYARAWREGARDYWQSVSLKPRPPAGLAPDRARADAALRFYTPSIAKLALEARRAYAAGGGHDRVTLDDLADWEQTLGPRLVLQGEIVWSSLQDGYADAGADDGAAPWHGLYWLLGAVKTFHCSDCPSIAAGSPYDPPGNGPKQLWQTPGDGRTRCGAGCKCSLQYGPAVYREPTMRTRRVQGQDGRSTWEDVSVHRPAATSLSDAQKGALDLYRARQGAWDAARGDLPEMPDLFEAVDGGALEEWQAAYARMSPRQQAIFDGWLDAIQEWNGATVDVSVDESGDQALADVATGHIALADADKPEEHTGIMVAFFLKPDAARALALPDGEPADELHVTLVYLGDMADFTPAQLKQLRREVRLYAAQASPLKGTVSGIGRFNPGPGSEDKSPVIALVNAHGIQEWRARLRHRFVLAGLAKEDEPFAYTPHVTLAYVEPGAPMPVESVKPVPLVLDRLTLAIGDERTEYPLHEGATE